MKCVEVCSKGGFDTGVLIEKGTLIKRAAKNEMAFTLNKTNI